MCRWWGQYCIMYMYGLSILDYEYWLKNKKKYLLGAFLFSIIYISNFLWASFFEKLDDYINIEWANSMSLMSFISTPLVYFCYNSLTEKKIYMKLFLFFILLGWGIPILSNNIKIQSFEKIEVLIFLWQLIIGITLIVVNQLNFPDSSSFTKRGCNLK